MKYIITVFLFAYASITFTQSGIAQLDQVNVDVQTQDGVLMVSTIGEPSVNISFNEGVAVVLGFYPVTFFEETSGIRYNKPIAGLSAYPNPANTFVTLSTEDSGHPERIIELFDVDGALISLVRWPSHSQVHQISIHNLAAGSYTIHVYEPSTNHASNLKLIKQ